MANTYDLGEVKQLRETEKARLLTGGVFGSRKEWVAKSQTYGRTYKSFKISVWLAKKIGVVTERELRDADNVCADNVEPTKPSRFTRLMRLAKTKNTS